MAEDDWDGWAALTDRRSATGCSWSATTSSSPTAERLARGIERGVANSSSSRSTRSARSPRRSRRSSWPPASALHERDVAPLRARPRTPPSPTSPWPPTAARSRPARPARSDRVAKYNQLLRIEEDLGEAAAFRGRGRPGPTGGAVKRDRASAAGLRAPAAAGAASRSVGASTARLARPVTAADPHPAGSARGCPTPPTAERRRGERRAGGQSRGAAGPGRVERRPPAARHGPTGRARLLGAARRRRSWRRRGRPASGRRRAAPAPVLPTAPGWPSAATSPAPSRSSPSSRTRTPSWRPASRPLQTPEEIERVAREQYNLAGHGEQVFSVLPPPALTNLPLGLALQPRERDRRRPYRGRLIAGAVLELSHEAR